MYWIRAGSGASFFSQIVDALRPRLVLCIQLLLDLLTSSLRPPFLSHISAENSFYFTFPGHMFCFFNSATKLNKITVFHF